MNMRKLIISALLLVGLSVHAYDYPYLIIETSDGSTTTISVESLSLAVSGSSLVATTGSSSQSFTLSDLSKMYFSADSGTSGIEAAEAQSIDENEVIYDMNGRQVTRQQMRRGIYVIKSKNGIRKLNVK